MPQETIIEWKRISDNRLTKHQLYKLCIGHPSYVTVNDLKQQHADGIQRLAGIAKSLYPRHQVKVMIQTDKYGKPKFNPVPWSDHPEIFLEVYIADKIQETESYESGGSSIVLVSGGGVALEDKIKTAMKLFPFEPPDIGFDLIGEPACPNEELGIGISGRSCA